MLRALRYVGFIEGTSFLVLLLIAMPLRYFTGDRGPVKLVGSAHGGLFLLYIAIGLAVALRHRWTFRRLLTMALAAVLPLGTFVFDGALRKEEREEGTL